MADGEVSKPTARTKKLTARFGLAVAFANQLHRRQPRKGSSIPYMSHLLGVASLALEHGANEDEAIAAVLHDAVEDQGGEPTLETICRTFGEKVAGIVDECTDAVVIPKPAWEPRKRAYIAGLAKASKGALLVSAADKLHNVRSMLGDYREVGEALWPRFKGGKDGTLWYYSALIKAYRKTKAPVRPPKALISELERTLRELKRLARVAGASRVGRPHGGKSALIFVNEPLR